MVRAGLWDRTGEMDDRMPDVRIDGGEYWAGRHPRFGVVVYAARWQEGLPSRSVWPLALSMLGRAS